MYQKHLEICRAATPAPWTAKNIPSAGREIFAKIPQLEKYHKENNTNGTIIWQLNVNAYISPSDQPQSLQMIGYEPWVQFPPNWWKKMIEANAEFIAFARNHMEQYITRCQELESELQIATAEKKKLESAAIDKHLRIQGLEAESKRLRNALANIALYCYDRRHCDHEDVECLRVMAIKALGVTP